MYISLNWIKDFVDLEGLDEKYLVDKFTMSCAEVDGYEIKGQNLSGVVVGKILSVDAHPNSKKLHLLKVDVGSEILDIVCGAPNVRVGLRVPVAKDGANVCGVKITPAVVGGYKSYGMCCSAHELGISDDNSGLMELDDNFPIGADIKSVLPIDDCILEVDNTALTNRPDLWGHYGIAREFAAITGRPLKKLIVDDIDRYDKLDNVDISIESKKCLRYCGMKIAGVTKTTSPYAMQIRLYYTGMRAINLLTDLTNYIMLEVGQPMHAFDGSKVSKIVVKELGSDTKFKTLDGQERTLARGTLVIDNGLNPVAVAGVMGGLDSEIEDSTGELLLESANFDATTIRRSAKALGMRTEASNRYEKKLDPELCDTAIARYLYLLKSIDSDVKVISKCTDVYVTKYPNIVIKVDKKFIDKYIGKSLPMDKIIGILESLHFGVLRIGDTLEVHVPSYRATKDITCKADIVEEITRIYGYDNFAPLSSNWTLAPVTQSVNVALDYDVKLALATRYNLHEVGTRIWEDQEKMREIGITSSGYLRVINSINGENNFIRNSMIPTLLSVAKQNEDMRDFGIFEIGHVVSSLDKDNLAVEEKHLGIALVSSKDYSEVILRAKDILNYLSEYVLCRTISLRAATPVSEYMHPVNYYEIMSGESVIGRIGLIHPNIMSHFEGKLNIAVVELNMTEIYNLEESEVKPDDMGRFPVTTLDFNLVLPAGRYYSEIEDVANNIASPLKFKYTLVDVYDNAGDDTKSYTIRFQVTSLDHTLNSSEIETFHKQVIEEFSKANINLKA